MSRSKRAHAAPRRGPRAGAERHEGGSLRREGAWVAALLALHVVLAVWGVLRNSVTFDENFHLPAGVLILQRGDYSGSVAQPPLPKVLYAVPAILLGARLSDDSGFRSGDEYTVGASFMRANRARYTTLYDAARLVALLFSLALGILVWRWARAVHGGAGGVLALALYTLAPESLAHAGIVGTDLPTALAFAFALFRLWRFVRAPSLRRWAWLAVAWALAFVTRFSAVQLVPVFVLVAALAQWTRRTPRAPRVWLGLLALVPIAWLAVVGAYGFRLYVGPWRALPLRSHPFLGLVRRLPAFRMPLPDAYIAGLDYMLMLNQEAVTYLLGRIHPGAVWYYFPLALLFKYPLGFLGAVAARAGLRPKPEQPSKDLPAAWVLGVAAGVFLLFAMFSTKYNFGVRYLLPLLPLACVWCGGLLAPRASRVSRRAGLALAALLAVETALCAPWYLSFFNWPSGGPGGGYRLVNDSNVDWGQGLIALREEMARRGIRRIHLAYHGTTDPALYGIDYVPYLGGEPGRESDWLAVSSYYFVGLSQHMVTPQGRTPPVRIDFGPLSQVRPAARPADCIYLFPLRGAGLAR